MNLIDCRTSACDQCKFKGRLHATDIKYVPADRGNNRILVLGESPNKDDYAGLISKPFLSPAGVFLRTEMEVITGYKSNYSNVISCTSISGEVPTDEEVAYCKTNILDQFIKQEQFTNVLLMGRNVYEKVLPPSDWKGKTPTSMSKKLPVKIDGASYGASFSPNYILRDGGSNSENYPEFINRLKKLSGIKVDSGEVDLKYSIVGIDSLAMVLKMFENFEDLGLDLESNSLDTHAEYFKILGFAISCYEFAVYVTIDRPFNSNDLSLLRSFFNRKSKSWVYNTSMESNAFWSLLGGPIMPQFNDALILCRLEGMHASLKVNARKLFNVSIWEEQVTQVRETFRDIYVSIKRLPEDLQVKVINGDLDSLTSYSSLNKNKGSEILVKLDSLRDVIPESDIIRGLSVFPNEWESIPVNLMGEYCCYDAYYALLIKQKLWDKHKNHYSHFMAQGWLAALMEGYSLKWDDNLAGSFESYYTKEAADSLEKIVTMIPFYTYELIDGALVKIEDETESTYNKVSEIVKNSKDDNERLLSLKNNIFSPTSTKKENLRPFWDGFRTAYAESCSVLAYLENAMLQSPLIPDEAQTLIDRTSLDNTIMALYAKVWSDDKQVNSRIRTAMMLIIAGIDNHLNDYFSSFRSDVIEWHGKAMRAFGGVNVDDMSTYSKEFMLLHYLRRYKKVLKSKSTYINGKTGRGSVYLAKIDPTNIRIPPKRLVNYFDAKAKGLEPNDKDLIWICDTSFMACSADTLRWRSGFHVIPWGSELRELYVPRSEDTLLGHYDYAAMEVRALASISGDEGLLEAFRMGYDIHRYNASMIYKKAMEEVTDAERRNAKLSCVTGDTLIKLMDGTSKPIKDLAGMSDFWVYSLDQLTGKFVPGFVKECYRTKTTDKLAYVTLDNGSVVKCTPDHEFLLRDGSYVEAQNLSSGDSLAALYTKLSTGDEGLGVSKNYELIQDLDGTWELTHRRVVQSVPVRKGIISGKEVVVIHHCDFTKFNNTPENLIVTDFSNHGELHGDEQVSRIESVVDEFMTDEFKSRPDYRNGHESLESYVAGEISRRWQRCYNYDDMSGKDKALAETASSMMNDKTFLTSLKTELDKQSIIKVWSSHTTDEYLSRIRGLVTWSDERRKSKSEEMLEDNKNWWTSRSRNANINKAAYLIKDLIHAGLDPSKEYNNYRSNSLIIRWENLPSELGITYDKLIEYAKGSKHFPRPIKLLDTTKQSETGVARMEHLWTSSDQDAVEFRERHSTKQSKIMTGLNSDEETKLAQARSKCLKSLKLMISAVGFDSVTEETYDELRWKLVELKLTVSSTNTPTLNRVKVLFESLDKAKERALTYNHSVVSVKIVDEECDVYDLAVDGYRNYVIDLGDGSGVAVENTFGILYGQTAEAFAAEHLKGDVATAKKLFADFYIAFPKVGAWIKRMHELAAANNEVPTIFGNMLKLDPSNYNTMLRTAQNFPIQSSSSNVAGESIWLLYVTAMIRNITFIPQVFTHDSCDFEFNTKDLFSIIDLMQEVAVDNVTTKYNLIVKIDWEVGNSQSDTFELKLLNKADDDSERTFEFSCNDRAYEPTLTKLRKFFDLEVVLSKRESKLQPLAEMWVVRRAFSKYLGEYVDAIKGTITLKKKL